MGADELFGGYRKHRTALNVEGWNGLRNELQLDLSRISTRNLGRDNRIISDHGCQGRLPYLDESIVSYVSSLQPWERYFTLLRFVLNFCYSSTKISVSTLIDSYRTYYNLLLSKV
jgi:hypothetical protein